MKHGTFEAHHQLFIFSKDQGLKLIMSIWCYVHGINTTCLQTLLHQHLCRQPSRVDLGAHSTTFKMSIKHPLYPQYKADLNLVNPPSSKWPPMMRKRFTYIPFTSANLNHFPSSSCGILELKFFAYVEPQSNIQHSLIHKKSLHFDICITTICRTHFHFLWPIAS